MANRLVAGMLRVPPIRSLNSMVDRLTIKVRTFEDYYGSDLRKTEVIPQEEIGTPEIESIPRFPRSRNISGSSFVSASAYIAILDDVIYDPVSNLLLSGDREVFADSLFPHHPIISADGRWNSSARASDTNPYWYNFHKKQTEAVSGVCSIFRGIYKAYFHNLISEIPRTSLVGRAGLPKSQPIKLLYAGTLSAAEAHFIPGLLAANMELTPVRSDRLYRIERLVFPSYLNQQGSGYLPQSYLDEFRHKFMPKRPRSKKQRIFISRRNFASKWGKRHILNEDLLLSRLGKLGFRRYFMESMSIADQVDLFYDAEMVIAAHGSALSNILYSSHVNVLELNPEFAIHPYFYLLSKSVGGQYKFWFARHVKNPDESKLFANFSVDIEEVMDLASDGLSGAWAR